MFLSVRLSPDEQRLLVHSGIGAALLEPNQPGRLALSDLTLTTLWSSDGSRFLMPRGTRLVERAVSGGEERELANVPGLGRLEDVSPDGRVVLFTPGALPTAVYALRLDGSAAARIPVPVAQGSGVFNTRFSPDGRWIVYDERLSGVGDVRSGGIYVQPFPGPGLRKQVTTTGSYPTWRKDGGEIVYLDGDRVWSVRVDTAGGEIRTEAPEALFPFRPAPGGVPDISPLSVSRDGSRFYFPQALDQPDSDLIHVRMGWAK